MGKLHEHLAIQDITQSASKKLLAETNNKFTKVSQYFLGYDKRLKMLTESAENAEIELSGSDAKALPTTVRKTLEYVFDLWAKAENVIYQINATNQRAKAHLIFREVVLFENVPVDELLRLENVLAVLRNTLDTIPTLDPSRRWVHNSSLDNDIWVSEAPDVTTKTEKIVTPVVLYPATDKHPAQVEKISTDKVVGTFTTMHYSGSATSVQKAAAISVVDELIEAAKTARMRANMEEVVSVSLGKELASLIMTAFRVDGDLKTVNEEISAVAHRIAASPRPISKS